jgi:hypothetical protein
MWLTPGASSISYPHKNQGIMHSGRFVLFFYMALQPKSGLGFLILKFRNLYLGMG